MSQLSSPGLPSLAEIAANPHRIAMLSGPMAAAFSGLLWARDQLRAARDDRPQHAAHAPDVSLPT
jgi:hypothetical protein